MGMLYEYEGWPDVIADLNGIEYVPEDLPQPSIKPVQIMENVWVPECLAS